MHPIITNCLVVFIPLLAMGSPLLKRLDRMNFSEVVCVCSPEEQCNGHLSCITKYGCYASVSDDHLQYGVKRGCLASAEQTRMICKMKSERNVAVECCDGNYCNREITPEIVTQSLESPVSYSENPDMSTGMILALALPMAVLICLIPVIIVICRHIHRKRMAKLDSADKEKGLLEYDGIRATQVGESTLGELFEDCCSSGSGSGLPLLVQQTVAKQITLIECIGKGRYGQVWKGNYHDEHVAVKIFSSRDEASWIRETEIYNTCLLRHDNILGYYASDMTSRNSCTQLWLIMHYHVLGSLYDYLQMCSLDCESMLRLALTAATGLTHLHTEIVGKYGKAAIAHRDVKTRNILVKKDGTCCIGDLGLAVMHKEDGNLLDLGHNQRVGTKRYMAPEVLNETLNVNRFESFKAADVYSFGLVIWEIARRCSVGGMVEDYRPPFWNVVSNDPSFEDMKKVVVIDRQRPIIPNRWMTDRVMLQLTKVMSECWAQNPNGRLTMLRLKKTLSSMLSSAENDVKLKIIDKFGEKERK